MALELRTEYPFLGYKAATGFARYRERVLGLFETSSREGEAK